MADKGEIISVGRVVSPPGYGALGDVVSLGLAPPPAPVTVSLALPALPDQLCAGRPKSRGMRGGCASSPYCGCSQEEGQLICRETC